MLAFEKADRVAYFRRQSGECRPADVRHASIALLYHHARGVRIERAVCSKSLRQRLAAVIDAAHENELLLAADHYRALQVSHVQKEERFLSKSFRIGELESIE